MASSTFQSPTSPANASQAQQEAGSSTSVYVSPGVQQYHPSASKAWALFNGTGTPALSASYNITSITDNGAGDYTLNFTTAFSSANFSVSGTSNSATSGANVAWIAPTTWAVGSIRFGVRNSLAGAFGLGDESQISIQCFGDQ